MFIPFYVYDSSPQVKTVEGQPRSTTAEGRPLYRAGLKPPGSYDCEQTVAGRKMKGKCWD